MADGTQESGLEMNEECKELLSVLGISVFVCILYLYSCLDSHESSLNSFLTIAPLFFFLTLPLFIKKYQIIKNRGLKNG